MAYLINGRPTLRKTWPSLGSLVKENDTDDMVVPAAKHQSKPVAPPSALARALFSSLPHSKVKEARPFLQFRGDRATGSRLKDGGALGSHSLFSWSPPLSMSRDSGIGQNTRAFTTGLMSFPMLASYLPSPQGLQ